MEVLAGAAEQIDVVVTKRRGSGGEPIAGIGLSRDGDDRRYNSGTVYGHSAAVTRMRAAGASHQKSAVLGRFGA